MITKYILSQNGRTVNTIEGTFEQAVAQADKFAETHKGDWTGIFTTDRPRRQLYNRCDEIGVREVIL